MECTSEVSNEMEDPSDSQPLPLSGNRNADIFPSMLGILTAAALPTVLFFLGGDSVTRGGAIHSYIGTIATLLIFFLLLLAVGKWIQMRNWPAAESLAAAYVTFVVPLNCLLIALTVILQFPLTGYIMGIVLIHSVFLPIWWFARSWVETSAFFEFLHRRVVSVLPLLYGGIFWGWFSQRYAPLIDSGRIAALLVMVAVFTAFSQSERLQNFGLRWREHGWIFLLIGLILFGLVYQPELPFLRSHANTFLSTMEDMLNGKIICVDTLSQYGIGVVYFLLAVFQIFRLPVSYPGLVVLLNALYILQFALLFLILHKATRSLYLSLAGLAAILYFAFFAVTWPSMLYIPAQSPLRYGWTYLLVGAGWIGLGRTGKNWRILEGTLLGAASLWGLEAFLYAFLSFDAVLFTGEVLFSPEWKEGLRRFVRRLLIQIGVVIFCWGAWWSLTAIAAGRPPNLSYYLDVFASYTSSGKSGPRMDFHSFWRGVVPTVYIGTILAVVFAAWKRRNRLPRETAALMAGLSVAGLLHFLYFFVYDLDFHLSLVCTPLIMVATLWLSVSQNGRTAEGIPRLNRWIFGMTIVGSIWVCMIQISPYFFSGIRNSLLYEMTIGQSAGEALVFKNPYRLPPSNDTVSTLVAFVEKYAAGERSIAIFARDDDQVEVLLLTHKTHLLDLTDPLTCRTSRSFTAHVLTLAEEYAGVPDYIFYDSTEGVLQDTQIKSFRFLTAGASYSVVDRKGNILVYRKE
jgi:hypothetical protein